MHDLMYSRELLVSNADNGYRDIIARIDPQSLRRIPWEENIALFLLSFYDSESGLPVAPDPRGLLNSVCERMARESGGYVAMAGVELEFFNFDETPRSLAEKQGVGLVPMTPGNFGYSILRPTAQQDFFYEIFDKCLEFGIPIEGWHTETGPGVYEAALKFSEARTMADRTSLFKLAVKQLALRRNLTSSFMAKPHNNLPGCSGHVHVSLVDKEGNNLFARDSLDTSPDTWDDIRGLSDIGRHFLAGLLQGLEDVMPMFAPTVNSYKRLVENFWAPVTVSWGLENRVSSIRLITPPTCSPAATRIEVRIPGADLVPHYALAAIVASGYRGVASRLPLTLPPLAKSGQGVQELRRLPRTLQEATARMRALGSLARELFGDEFVEHYCGTREHEIRLWNDYVTDWEVKRYMETV